MNLKWTSSYKGQPEVSLSPVLGRTTSSLTALFYDRYALAVAWGLINAKYEASEFGNLSWIGNRVSPSSPGESIATNYATEDSNTRGAH